MTNYPKQMYQQLEEQTEKVERLESENKRLRQENRFLGAELARVYQQMEALSEKMEARIAAAVDEGVSKAVEPLQATIQKQEAEIKRLKNIINKDSSNSSKPPSSDGFEKRGNNREPSVRKAGGQPGHKGHRLQTAQERR